MRAVFLNAGYAIGLVTLVVLFAFSAHVELVAVFNRKGTSRR